MTPSGPQILVIAGTSAAQADSAGADAAVWVTGSSPSSRHRTRGILVADVSGHALVGGQGEELHEVVGQRDLGEQRHSLPVALRVETGPRLLGRLADAGEFGVDDALDQLPGDLRALGERYVVVQPLPDLRAGDLRRGGILHQVEDAHRAVPAQPG